MKLTNSYIFVTVATFLFFLLNLFAIYLLLRGHNFPGGGFIGGLNSAISVILLGLAVGVRRMEDIIRVDPVHIAAIGLLLAILSSAIPLLWGHAFLTQYNWKLTNIPLLGDLSVGTPLVFDIGVYLVVVGVTIKLVILLARSIEGLPAIEASDRKRYSSPLEEPVEEIHKTLFRTFTSGEEDERK